jgi:predicted transglutaminase-like protease
MNFLLTIVTFLAPIQGLLILLICFIAFDTLIAIYVSIKMKGWKSFKSALLRKGMTSKVFLYVGSVILVFMVDMFVMGGACFGIQHLLSKGLASVWCYAEIKSCDENSMKIGNRSFFVIVKDFFQRITGYKDEIKKIIE